MYVIDDICYADSAGDGNEIRIEKVKPLPGRMLLVTFFTGEQRLYDTTTLTGSAFSVLDDERIFNNPVLFHGVITWDNGNVDIAPETVYADSFPYEQELAG